MQIINFMKILVAVMQLLFEDVLTDRQRDMANLKYAHLKLIIQKVLRIIAALANHPVVPEDTKISELTLPLQRQSTVYAKETELDHSSHSYFTPRPHQQLKISSQNTNPESSTRNITLLH
jgi:hypothetical protein